MSKPLGIAAWFLVLSGIAFAQTVPPNADWQKLRDHQPAALHLKMTLAKDHFYQGEKIDATLEFSNDDAQNIFSLMVGAGEPGAIFRGWDAQGHDLINPLQWRDEWLPINSMGPVGSYPIGSYTLIRPVNENIRFDQPGVCAIYALASVIQGSNSFKNFNGQRVELVSDPITVAITPITPEQEAQALAGAKRKIGTTDENYYFGRDAGVEELNFLQTPVARAELIPLLGKRNLAWSAVWGLEGAPDPPAEAARILAAVEEGKLSLDENGVDLYAELKTASLYVGRHRKDFTEQQAEDIEKQRWKILDEARREMSAALLKASGDQGPTHVEALWTAFKEQAIYRNPGDSDKDGGRARAAVAAHQLELSPEDVKRLLDAWPYRGSADFLPLIRREVKAGTYDPAALVILAGLSPEEARPLVIAELSRPDSKLLQIHYAASQLFPGVAPMPLPQFDTLFRAKLAEAGDDPAPIIPLIGCFGSDKLLPDVVETFHKYGKDWDDEIKRNLYLYWLRCDQKAGADAFEQEIQSRGKDGWAFFVKTFRTSWREEARPVVYWALDNANPSLTGEAIYLLMLHGTDSDLDPLLAALERLRTNKDYASFLNGEARKILADTRWHLTAEQKKRLEVLASTTTPK